ncbi:nucleoside triphosphate pyrophosphohydrolase [Kiloniella laminariae]|uniref:Nucleoside triphosphate pyrophosphohydrolase n=1 Tax=Kiloniella laminariae TaxID=454162 RepID=A0ABT4LP52_9PROT|nr:nucleoside triphosphate pyrophosphohydrolase [Kiloniella laminariae]MCZ4282091.1 nucleoside triphosphate pyrophosphohydrolase [Kiloniella laminariae]
MSKVIPDPTQRGIDRLIQLMQDLRSPDGGCPWDIEQTFETIAPYTIEEAYEVADAIERGDHANLQDELGDLLLQVVYHSQIAGEQELFDFDAVAQAITEKMIGRHPHVYGSADHRTAEEQVIAWEEIKAREREAKKGNPEESVLDGITVGLPAATRAIKLQRRAAKVGFDWPDLAPVIAKIHEEIEELKYELENKGSIDRAEDELGDVLFSVVNLARHLDLDPEKALRRTNAKFEKRFRAVEQTLKNRGEKIEQTSLDEMEKIWSDQKQL